MLCADGSQVLGGGVGMFSDEGAWGVGEGAVPHGDGGGGLGPCGL